MSPPAIRAPSCSHWFLQCEQSGRGCTGTLGGRIKNQMLSTLFVLSKSKKQRSRWQMYTLTKTQFTSLTLIKRMKDGLSSLLHSAWNHPEAPGTQFPKGSPPFWFCCKKEKKRGIKETPPLQILIFEIFSEAIKQSDVVTFIFQQLSTQESAKVMSKVSGTICCGEFYWGEKFPSPRASFLKSLGHQSHPAKPLTSEGRRAILLVSCLMDRMLALH